MASEPLRPSLFGLIRETATFGEYPHPDPVVQAVADLNGWSFADARTFLATLAQLMGAIHSYLGQSVATEDAREMLRDRLRRDFGLVVEQVDSLDPFHLLALLVHREQFIEFVTSKNIDIADPELIRYTLVVDKQYHELAASGEASYEIFKHAVKYMRAGVLVTHRNQLNTRVAFDTPFRSDESPEPKDLVTLNQAAGMAHKTKRALEYYKTKGTLPAPTVEGGGGKSDLYDWVVMAPWLEATFGVKQPARFPAGRRT